METLKKLWKILDGNKTIICMFALFVLKLDSVENALNPDLILALNWIFGLGAGASTVHHVTKGKLSKDKN